MNFNNTSFAITSKSRITSIGIALFIIVIFLSVVQDFVFSQIRNTGFYISESLLYNTIWLFLIPFSYLGAIVLQKFSFPNKYFYLPLIAVSAIVLSIVHLFMFTSFFVLVSNLVFSPGHRFVRIFGRALSNELSFLIIFYGLAPFAFQLFMNRFKKKSEEYSFSNSIKIKVGLRTVSIDTHSITKIITEKPYSLVVTDLKEYLDNRPLKDFEIILDPNDFIRVHRSVIINKASVKELKSRKNGDFDALLSNGESIRFSRHYRSNWETLLH